MNDFIVLYWSTNALPADPPESLLCQAQDTDEAERLTEIENPGCSIAWVVETDDFEEVYRDYWGDSLAVA